jgi:hypothetical protein
MVRAKNANPSAYGALHLTATHRADYSSTIATGCDEFEMIPARNLINEIIASLREVIAPAIAEQYPKSQAYMAAVILEFVARQVEERSDIEAQKHAAMMELMRDLARFPEIAKLVRADHLSEAGLCDLIEHLYGERDRLGEATFAAANQRIRQTLRELLDAELKVAGKAEA